MKYFVILLCLFLSGCKITENDIEALENKTKSKWIRCPICDNDFARGEYFTHHNQTHKEKK